MLYASGGMTATPVPSSTRTSPAAILRRLHRADPSPPERAGRSSPPRSRPALPAARSGGASPARWRISSRQPTPVHRLQPTLARDAGPRLHRAPARLAAGARPGAGWRWRPSRSSWSGSASVPRPSRPAASAAAPCAPASVRLRVTAVEATVHSRPSVQVRGRRHGRPRCDGRGCRRGARLVRGAPRRWALGVGRAGGVRVTSDIPRHSASAAGVRA